MRGYRRLKAGAFLFFLGVVVVAHGLVLTRTPEIFPVFCWALFIDGAKREVTDFEIAVDSLDGRRLAQPVGLFDPQSPFSLSATTYHVIQSLGKSVLSGDSVRIQSKRRLIESAMFQNNGKREMTYTLLSRKFDALERLRGVPAERVAVRSFRAGEE